jgi:hypothetical protein
MYLERKIESGSLCPIFVYLLPAILLISFSFFIFTEVVASEKPGAGPVELSVEQSDSFSFIVWGHPRSGRGRPPVHFEEILDRISGLDVDFTVVTGDVIAGTYIDEAIDTDAIRSDWKRFDERFKSIGIPVYRIPGNHDVSNFITRNIYLERYTRPPYAITYNNSRLIFLDTVGINQRTEDGNPNWKPQMLPFDEVQLSFIRNEIKNQDNFAHVFFFMHHVFWRDPSAPWWQDVHPMLKGGKTRVVFAGTPGNPGYKYEHFEQDGIHYIDSCTFSTPSVKSNLKKMGPALKYQADNLQLVRVAGTSYTVKTIIVGEWNSKNLSSRFWAEVERPLGVRENVKRFFSKAFHSFFKFTLGNLIWGGAGLFGGILIALAVRRRNSRKFEEQKR